ncbi:RNA polymerase sigma factor [Parvicella tangerina]|uniref:RNA polymerase sigma factor n=1 Tax=Parvicella tangerina TaxID=2829795 RepID=UPI00215D350C|nr:RNA polymerase sigma factor [Parvicella tangerina]
MNFDKIYQEHKDLVYNLALKYLQNIEDAEEVTQDVFVSIFKNYDTFNQDAEMTTWVYRITINKSLDFIKAKKAKKRLGFLSSIFKLSGQEAIFTQDHFNHPGVQLKSKEEVAFIMNCINQLPDKQKTALILHKLEDRSQVEVAEIMNLSPKAVESLVQRAKVKLKKIMQQAKENE